VLAALNIHLRLFGNLRIGFNAAASAFFNSLTFCGDWAFGSNLCCGCDFEARDNKETGLTGAGAAFGDWGTVGNLGAPDD